MIMQPHEKLLIWQKDDFLTLIKASRRRSFNLFWYNDTFKNCSSSARPVGWLRWTVLSDSRWKTANLSVISVSVENERKKSGGSHLCISSSFLPFILLTLLSACLLSICFLSVPPPLLSLFSALALSLSLLVQGDESGCVQVWKSTPQGLYSQPHERFMMLTRVCASVHVCVWGGDWKKRTRRDRGKKGGSVGG